VLEDLLWKLLEHNN